MAKRLLAWWRRGLAQPYRPAPRSLRAVGRSNCLLWALRTFWKRRRSGAFVLIWSPRSFKWHAGWSREIPKDFTSFTPLQPKRGCAGFWHKIWFDGQVRKRRKKTMVTRIPNAAALERCNAQVDRLDAGAGPGYIEVRSGTQPAFGDDTASGTLLVTIPLQSPAFGNAVDMNPGARASLNGLPSANAGMGGTAGWFRAYDSNGNPVQDGAVTATNGGGEMQIDNPVITQGATVTITSWHVDELESA